MKVLLLNGSPHEGGNTFAALSEVAGAIEKEGLETEVMHLGAAPVRGCIGCFGCQQKGENRCVFDDAANAFIAKAEQADGIVISSPVYYASPNGSVLALLDRVFFAGGRIFRGKPGAAIAVARRAGTTATLDALNKYFAISGMPVPGSQYWPLAHGMAPGEVGQDGEGMQTMRELGRQLAWLIRCIEAGKAAGITLPAPEPERAWTNFIR